MPFPTLLYLRPRFSQKVNGQNPDRHDPDGSLIKKEHVTYLLKLGHSIKRNFDQYSRIYFVPATGARSNSMQWCLFSQRNEYSHYC